MIRPDSIQDTKDRSSDTGLLLMVAGAKGAIATTVALALCELSENPGAVLSGLTTTDRFVGFGIPETIRMVGWDTDPKPLLEAVHQHGVIPESRWRPHKNALADITLRPAPPQDAALAGQVETLRRDMRELLGGHPGALPVLVNLLPAACDFGQAHRLESLEDLTRLDSPVTPDLSYAVAALLEGIPIVNFTPNTIELPLLCREAALRNIPLAGRDGKTGQTYLKVVLASALKARSLKVDGWYSLNILGNADGKNLMDPDRACGKLQNKTNLLDEILGYGVGEAYGETSHKVHIDYYPPRGDAKEAWDVIDFKGIFGLPMSLRLNLQGRDSILAAPMVIDLARWAAALKLADIGGPCSGLGFYFKKAVGDRPPITFQEQLAALDRLEERIAERLSADQC